MDTDLTPQPAPPPWQELADHLRYALAQLDPKERRQILDFLEWKPEPPKAKSYPIRDCMRAARRVAELLAAHPKWTRAHARRDTAQELGITSVQLRRMLRHVEQ